MVSLLFAVLCVYLFLNEQLLLCDVFKLLLGFTVLLAAESLVSRVSDIGVSLGNLLG